MRIRMATADDARSVRDIYAPIVEGTTTSFELTVPSADELTARITERQPAHPWLVAEDDGNGREGRIAGYAYAGRFSGRAAYDWSVETSIYLAESARGRGVGRTLYGALLALLTAQGYHQAMAGITLPNPASVGLHQEMGFTPVGVYRSAGRKFGAWRDVGWWQRTLATVDGEPRPPAPLDVLPARTIAAALAAGGQVSA
jgi:L-amino acid N-acyltransferase YncA